MKSIRRSLIVYVLVLLTAALGAVSWFSYGTTAQSLRERQRDAQEMIAAQCNARTRAVKDELDLRIRREAERMAHTARSAFVNTNGLSLTGVAPWLVQGSNPPLPYELIRTHPPFLVLIEDDLGGTGHEHPQEYFQTYQENGQPSQRSESMGDRWFTLKDEQKKAKPWAENFDDVELKPGVKLRQVTLKAEVGKGGGSIPLPRPWPWGRGGPGGGQPKGGPLAKGGGPPPKNPQPPKGPPKNPTVFIQYASDVAPTEAKIAEFQKRRDDQIADLEATIGNDLAQLRTRMLGIGLATLAALWLGGYLVICLGLAPLAKMTDAVSKVSPQNFHLSLDAARLPDELQPIAVRLEETLEQLHKAFDREKQAAADISHELRTPLAALMTTLDVGLRKSRSVEEYREILGECRSSGQHMYQLVERLLTLARLDAGADQYHPAQVDVIETALACADLIRPLARAANLDLRLNLPDEPITTQTDPNKLREVLINLLHNAVEYNKPDGAIDLIVERMNGHVRFEVRDTGIGIEPETKLRLFERFYRADPSRHADTPHAGLGLSIVKSYVDLMGGAISVESSAAGSVFRVEIPFVAPVPVETGIRAMAELASARGTI